MNQTDTPSVKQDSKVHCSCTVQRTWRTDGAEDILYECCIQDGVVQCFSTFVRPRPGKYFFHKKRARSQQIYS